MFASLFRFRPSILTFCILHSAFCISSSGAAPAEAALAQLAAGLERFVLENGLTVLAREDTKAPVVSLQVWVGAGAVHEQEFLGGGLSHLLEHMIFKGTPTREPGEISRTISDLGGSINAYTSQDRTVFLVDIPAAHWRKGLSVLADAVLNASFPEDEWRREKDVVRREMAMGKDNPARRVGELLWQTAYRVHSYRFPVIGYEDIFKTLTRADLLTFFRRHYLPNNMIVAIVGDVPGAEVRAEVQKQFGQYPRRAYSGVILNAEPEQLGERTARETGAWNVARLEWAWHTVELSHPDTPSLDLLAIIVGQGNSSRLVREIRENRKLASEITAWSHTPRDPGLFGISAVFDPTNEPELTLALQEEIARWLTLPFSAEEIEKARRQMLTGTLGAFETMHGQAEQFASGEFYAGTPFFFQVYLQRLNRVTPASLAAAARRHLRAENLTRVALAPDKIDDGRQPALRSPKGEAGTTDDGERKTKKGTEKQTPNAQHPTSNVEGLKSESGATDPAKRETGNEVQKTILSSGLTLLTRADHKLPFVDFRVACGGGLLLEDESNNGISVLMAELLTRGAARRSAQDIASLVESRGGSLEAFGGQNSFGLTARCLKEDAEIFMELLADCLLNPAFAAEETAKQKSIQLAAIKAQHDAPMFLAQEALRQALFPGHPYRFSPDGAAATVQSLSPMDLRAFHARTVVRDNTVLAIFGDLTTEQARALAERFLGQFPVAAAVTPPACSALSAAIAGRWPPAPAPGAPQPTLPRQVTRTAPREQTIILTGFPGIELKDPRRAALDVLQEALNGLSSDLMIRIRDKEGLAYYTGAWQRPGLDPGFFALFAGTHTGAAERVLRLMQQEVKRLTTKGLRAEEFERARAQLIAEHQQRLQLNGETALECALNELYGLGYDYGFKLAERLAELKLEDVRQAAATLLVPEKCVTVVVRPRP
ncbi:MAG: insulinase family protein [Lentisphaerae bacterium]|nr:insulinase family protein [Lentisphaerota bacterium]